MCKATGKKGFLQLSHFDADHQDGFKPQANLSHMDDPNANVPTGPHLVTTKEPGEKEIDEDEIVFTDNTWCCIVPNAPDSATTFIHIPVKGNNVDHKLDHDENLGHEENSKEESVSPRDKNANCSRNNDHFLPNSVSAHGILWGIMVWIATVGLYLLNGATLAIMGPVMQMGEGTLKQIKSQ
jgi:hypothetical protein